MSKISLCLVSASVRVCPRIASLGKRATPSRATDTVRWPRSPAPSRRWSWRCTSTRQGTIFIFPASRTLGGPTCSGNFSSPASARPRRRRTCFTSTISMIRIVHAVVRPGGAGQKLRSVLSQALADIRKELPVRLDNEKYVKKRSELQDRFQAVRSGSSSRWTRPPGKRASTSIWMSRAA